MYRKTNAFSHFEEISNRQVNDRNFRKFNMFLQLLFKGNTLAIKLMLPFLKRIFFKFKMTANKVKAFYAQNNIFFRLQR